MGWAFIKTLNGCLICCKLEVDEGLRIQFAAVKPNHYMGNNRDVALEEPKRITCCLFLLD